MTAAGTGHAPSPPPRHRAEEKLQAQAKAGPGDSDNASRTAGRKSTAWSRSARSGACSFAAVGGDNFVERP
jgi:hypothetical protein